jgi:hypothetical protein
MPAAQSAVSTAARAANVATIVTAAAHDLTTGDVVDITGIVSAGFNDTDQTVTVTNATTFTYANVGANLGATAEAAGRVDPESTVTVSDASTRGTWLREPLLRRRTSCAWQRLKALMVLPVPVERQWMRSIG